MRYAIALRRLPVPLLSLSIRRVDLRAAPIFDVIAVAVRTRRQHPNADEVLNGCAPRIDRRAPQVRELRRIRCECRQVAGALLCPDEDGGPVESMAGA
jgi:hypothetical protein